MPAGYSAAELDAVLHVHTKQALLHMYQQSLVDERSSPQLARWAATTLLRNPLQAVFASGDMLEHKFTDPALLALASRIKASVRRMSSLIDDVLDFARGRLGRGMEVEFAEVENINTGLETAVQELRDAQPGCTIISDISVDHPVRCDLGRLQQIASNLLATP